MRDLREFYDPDLHLPINGVTYTVKCPTAEAGLRIKRHFLDPESDPMQEVYIIAELFGAEYDPDSDTMTGGLWDEMNAGGVAYEEIMHVGNTAMAHYGVSPEFGELWWETRLGKEHLPLVPEAAEQWMKDKQEAEAEAKAKPKAKKTTRRKKTTTS